MTRKRVWWQRRVAVERRTLEQLRQGVLPLAGRALRGGIGVGDQRRRHWQAGSGVSRTTASWHGRQQRVAAYSVQYCGIAVLDYCNGRRQPEQNLLCNTSNTTSSINTVYLYAVVTCDILLFQNYFRLRRRPLFQHVETCLKLFQDYFTGLGIAAHKFFQRVHCRRNNFEIVSELLQRLK